MWGEGQSASQIAKELGGVTRNAVIGKVHRLGLSGRVSDTTSFYFRYQHDFGRDGQENQEVSAAARMRF